MPQTPLLRPDPFSPTPGMRKTNQSRVDTTADAVGLYAIDELALTDWLKVIGGLRWDYFHANQKTVVTGVEIESTDKVLSPRTALVLEPTRNQTYYFSYGTSFNPSAENLTLAANNANLDPELNRVFELGAKWQLLDNRLAVRSALFLIEKTDARTNDPDSGIVTLDGKQRSRGFEIEVVGQLLPGWNLWAGYTYLDTRVLESKDIQGGIPIEIAPDVDPRFRGGPGVSGSKWAAASRTSASDSRTRTTPTRCRATSAAMPRSPGGRSPSSSCG